MPQGRRPRRKVALGELWRYIWPAVVAFYVFLLVVAAAGALGYVMLFFSHVPGAADERLGPLEELPADLGKWVIQGEPDGDGVVKERRFLLADPSSPDSSKVLIQVRFRDTERDEIVKIDPEETYRRKRRKK